ncbi:MULTISPECIES: hypothetical protein [Aquimarina]|nr:MULTISPECIES: hypothetical protein [Aquimarina]
MKSIEKKTLNKLRLSKTKIVSLTNNEKNKILGGSASSDAKTGVPCIAAY